jgi:hypothetical protein
MPLEIIDRAGSVRRISTFGIISPRWLLRVLQIFSAAVVQAASAACGAKVMIRHINPSSNRNGGLGRLLRADTVKIVLLTQPRFRKPR